MELRGGKEPISNHVLGDQPLTMYSRKWLTYSLNYIYPKPNPNPNPMKRNQPMYSETPFVSYTVCINHVVEKVVSSTGGTVVYNANISVRAVVEAAEIQWKLRKLP